MDPKLVIAEILETAFKLSMEKDKIKEIFEKSGVTISDNKAVGVNGDSMDVLKQLMTNLSAMAVIKISAKQIIRKAGLNL
ncbi:MAG: hypothetical protein HQK84_04310 [Nitrospinae bacterium]|nr:hypothetical protein [Nitrospinota bacterium]